MTPPLRLLLNGARGRMGRAIAEVAATHDAEIVAAIEVGDDPVPALHACDVAIDFSVAEATAPLVEAAALAGRPVVIGTTGHDDAARGRILAAAETIPVVWSGNYSLGVNLLVHLVSEAARRLPPQYHAEIIELHHRLKRDAPSGTAERLIEVVREAREYPPETVRHGRHGLPGARPDAEIGVHAVRGGDIVGEHLVLFAGLGERLELVHRATDRRIFADGAIHAARWAVGRRPGRYRMEDVLGLRPSR